MKPHFRLLLKSLIFILPVVILLLLDNFLLPIGAFTFRLWEPMLVTQYGDDLPGPFYPNKTVMKNEQGDLAHDTPYATHRDATWITDRYGFRNRPEMAEHPSVVVTGDSMIVGSSLDQKETFSEVLSQKLGEPVYGLAPGTPSTVVSHPFRFRDPKPKLVIWEAVERLVPLSMSPPAGPRGKEPSPKDVKRWNRRLDPMHSEYYSRLDYFWKWVAFRRLRAQVDRWVRHAISQVPGLGIYDMGGIPPSWVATDGSMVFIGDASLIKEWSNADIDKYVAALKANQERLAQDGIAFLCMIIPNKDTIYWQKQQGAKKQPDNLRRLIDRLKAAGVPVVDTLSALNKARDAGAPILYRPDDSHWSPEGVRVCAEAVMETLKEHPISSVPAH